MGEEVKVTEEKKIGETPWIHIFLSRLEKGGIADGF